MSDTLLIVWAVLGFLGIPSDPLQPLAIMCPPAMTARAEATAAQHNQHRNYASLAAWDVTGSEIHLDHRIAASVHLSMVLRPFPWRKFCVHSCTLAP